MYFKKQLGSVTGLVALSALLGAIAPAAHAATYYVDAVNGNDSTAAYDPSTSTKPYKTIGFALYRAKAYFSSFGVNTVIVEPGVYSEAFSLAQNGLTLKARYDATATTSQRSIIRPSGAGIWNLVGIRASNVVFRGFEVDGSNAYIDTANNTGGTGAKPNITSYGDSTNGVLIEADQVDSSNNFIPAAQHVSVNHCVVHDNGGAGIGSQNANYNASADLSFGPTGGADYLSIDDNVVYNNSFWSKYATSGISLFGDTNRNTADSGYHCFIRRNRVYGNMAKYTGSDFFGAAKHTDGNGIIIDTCGNQNPPTLVENNLVYKNGGRGIHVFQSGNVTGRNNTLYKNNQDPDISATGGGELTAISCHNILYTNNIVYGAGGSTPVFVVKAGYAYAQAGGTMQNIVIRACTYWGASSGSSNIATGVIDWSTTWYGNPYLTAPDSGDLRVDVAPTLSGQTQAASQYVIDRASVVAGDFAADDFKGAARPGTGKDRGAYERSLTTQSVASTSAGAS